MARISVGNNDFYPIKAFFGEAFGVITATMTKSLCDWFLEVCTTLRTTLVVA
jgi:hypothetical protein